MIIHLEPDTTIRKADRVEEWVVIIPSTHTVSYHEKTGWHCDCPEFNKPYLRSCKHITAVLKAQAKEINE